MPVSTGCSKFASLLLVLLFGLIWSSITLVFDVMWGAGVYQQIAALGYPTVQGVVTDSLVDVGKGRHATTAPKITYTYQLGNKKYVCDKYRYHQVSSNDANARQVVDQYPVGRPVTVYYSPDDPSDAVLLAGIEGCDLFMAMFMTPFNIVMFSIWAGAVIALRNSRRPPIAGGARFSDDGYQLRVRLPRFAPWIVSLGLLFGASFLLTFVVAFSAGGVHPPLEFMEAVWAVLLLGALIAYTVARLRMNSGRSDLVIDLINGALTLPQTFGRKEPQTLAADQLRQVVVDEVEQRSSKGSTSHTYVPTLIWRDHSSAEHREKLGEWTDAARAEDFAAWLHERLKLKSAILDFGIIDRNL